MRNEEKMQKLAAINDAARKVVAYTDAARIAIKLGHASRSEALVGDVNHWIRRLNEIQQSGDSAKLRGLFASQRPGFDLDALGEISFGEA